MMLMSEALRKVIKRMHVGGDAGLRLMPSTDNTILRGSRLALTCSDVGRASESERDAAMKL